MSACLPTVLGTADNPAKNLLVVLKRMDGIHIFPERKLKLLLIFINEKCLISLYYCKPTPTSPFQIMVCK
jgi:hypothetical protein